MFNPGETVCVSNNEFGFHSIPLENCTGKVTLVSPNPKSPKPIDYCDSSELIFVAINPMLGFRLDSSVVAFRSFMWEIDIGPIAHQMAYFEKIKLPISAKIFSGNKSVHAITVLDEEIPDEKTYRFLYQWALNILTMCDQNCKNPSRSIRIPGAYRAPGKKQRLIEMKGRIKLKDFMDWLNDHKHAMPQPRKRRKAGDKADIHKLSGWARTMLTKGIVFNKGRNQTWFGLAVDFALAGFTEELTIETLQEHFREDHDFKEKEWLITIASAFKYAESGKK